MLVAESWLFKEGFIKLKMVLKGIKSFNRERLRLEIMMNLILNNLFRYKQNPNFLVKKTENIINPRKANL